MQKEQIGELEFDSPKHDVFVRLNLFIYISNQFEMKIFSFFPLPSPQMN
jgi:hypothetical protein